MIIYLLASMFVNINCIYELNCNKTHELTENHFKVDTLDIKIKHEVIIKCQQNNISKMAVKSFTFDSNQPIKLFLSHNSISIIPRGFFNNMRGLQIVNFSNNILEQIALDIFNDLLVLETIFLNHNNLSEINNGQFKTNINLKQIRLENNKIRFIGKDAFKYNLKLTIIKLNMNKLKILPVELFSNNPELSYLNLEFNEITELNPKLLSLNPNLKYLYLGDNNLKIIETDTLKNNDKIEILSLKKNDISLIEDNWLHLVNIKRLGIYRNYLQEFSEQIFRLPSLDELYVHRNKFNCDCDLHWTLNFRFPVFKYKEINLERKCPNTVAREFYIYDFIVEYRPKYKKAVNYLKSLNCTTDYKRRKHWIHLLPEIRKEINNSLVELGNIHNKDKVDAEPGYSMIYYGIWAALLFALLVLSGIIVMVFIRRKEPVVENPSPKVSNVLIEVDGSKSYLPSCYVNLSL